MPDQVVNFANLEIEISEHADHTLYVFKGDVDENFDQKAVPRSKKEHIVFALDHIDNFNSCGIREWIYLVKGLEEHSQITFRGCSVTMIDQINMVPDSLGAGIIESFYAPYYCEKDGEINQKIEVNEARKALQEKKAPDFDCPKCGSALEFDALEESYFLFADTGLQNAS